MKSLRTLLREALDRRFDRKSQRYLAAVPSWTESTKDLVANSFKPSHKSDEARRYKLCFCSTPRTFSYRRLFGVTVWWEMHYGIALTYDDALVAYIAFEHRREGVLVGEIQGVDGAKHALAPLRWDRLLYHAVLAYAAAIKAPQVAVQPARHNTYYSVLPNTTDRPLEKLAERQNRMKIIYDRVPLKCGFVWNPERELSIRRI